jgi:deoxycytidine triphosphate deaminase
MPTSVLSDGTIRRLIADGRVRIEPWDPTMVQPASVDVRLGRSFRVFHNFRVGAIDLADPPKNLTELVEIGPEDPFVIHPGEFVLGRTEEWVELPDDLVARIEGKALALDTAVPSPSGWTTMGALEVGDEVFDERGVPTPVVAATDVMFGRPCREVVFSDGTTVVADLDHLWEVHTRTDRSRGRPPRLVTTGQIEQRLHIGQRKLEYTHHVVQASPVHYPEKELPVDPYVLGVWIGDGTSTQSEITCADDQILVERRSHFNRAIVDVRPIASVPVRCIQVGSPRGLFLVTKSFIATHNSSIGRLGLIVHATAGFVDPGFKGTLTLEITNLTRVPIVLWPGKPIAQLSFMTLDAPAERPYGHPALGSHYAGQVEATESRYEGGRTRDRSEAG